ncbi:hypothetical protein B0H21DRAFT_832411 [Amylocystis lapponica]|nr:hypothetical protein B0H21DRAFT_832411 [Amylocystis lapponica]
MSYDEPSLTSSASNPSSYAIPKLSSDGSNWITYKTRILNVMRSRGLKRHLDGSARAPPPALTFPQPTKPTVATIEAATAAGPAALALVTAVAALAALTDEAYLTKVEASEKKVDEHDQKEGAARQLIYGTISNTLLLQIQDLPTAHNPVNKSRLDGPSDVLARSDILRASDRFRYPLPTAPDPETLRTCYVTDVTKAVRAAWSDAPSVP